MSLKHFGWGPRVATLFAELPTVERAVPARVTRVDRDRVAVATEEGPSSAAASDLPAVGDWVLLEPSGRNDVPWTVATTAPRWSQLRRTDPVSYGHETETDQVLAANVDLVISVTPLDRRLSPNRIEREMALAWDGGARPVIVLTKADRHIDAHGEAERIRRRLVGVDVMVTAALDGLGLGAVAELFPPDRTVALLGASGAGKSTLANALLGSECQETGGVRRSDARGRHTTTSRQLIPVPGGGVLLDTPGLRSLGLHGADEGVSAVFGDLEALATQCRFRNCAHDTEPGCALQSAIDQGVLDMSRLVSWRKLQRELERLRLRDDRAARSARNDQMRRATKSRRGRHRP